MSIQEQNSIYAGDLKGEFRCMGHFYQLSINGDLYPCRSSLEILRNDAAFGKQMVDESPDALVVMMNPGSSRPDDNNYLPTVYSADRLHELQKYKEYVPARPDNSQYQIMRLMLDQAWKHVRILNLSDLRSGNSAEFKNMFMSAANHDSGNPHSLFSIHRRQELFGLTVMERPTVILAWGRVTFLAELATEALAVFQHQRRCVGQKVAGARLSYFHANQRTPARLRSWLKEINHQLEI